jgi:hypothetical protein
LTASFFAFLEGDLQYFAGLPDCGVLAQLVERLNGIEKVRGSNPLGSKHLRKIPPQKLARVWGISPREGIKVVDFLWVRW